MNKAKEYFSQEVELIHTIAGAVVIVALALLLGFM